MTQTQGDNAHAATAGAANLGSGKSRSQLGRPAILVSLMTLISRLFGFARDVMVAQLFGATAAVDAFWVAFKIPNFLRRLFAEGAFQQAFVPVLSEYRETREKPEVKDFIDNMSGLLAVITFIVTIIGIIAAPLIVMVFAPGFVHDPDPTRYHLTTTMIRFTFPYLLFVSLTAFAGSILNCYGRFGVPAFTPVLLNAAMIVTALLFADHFDQPVISLAIGVFIGGCLQVLLQLPFLKRLQLLPKLKWGWQHGGVSKVLKLMLPAIFGVSVAQISLLFNTLFASFLQVGSVSWLYYSDRLTAFPLGIFGVGIATVILPLLSRRHAAKSLDEFNVTLLWATRIVIGIALPAAAGLLILAGPILATLFGYGEFSQRDVIMTRLSLMALAVGIPAFMLIKIYATGFYAQQDIRTPVRYAVIAMITNLLLNIALVYPYAHMGLALATSLASTLNVVLLLIGLSRQGIFKMDKTTWLFVAQSVLATVTMGLIVWWLADPLTTWLDWGMTSRLKYLSVLLISAMMAYFITLLILGVRWRHIRPPA